MAHRIVASWPDGAFVTSEEAARMCRQPLVDMSKALRISEPHIEFLDRSGPSATAVQDLDSDTAFADTTDAQQWAQAFMRRVQSGVEVDEGLMIGWFANAFVAQEREDREHG